MKITYNILIGLSSVLLIYFYNSTFLSVPLFLLIGILVGSTILNVNGNRSNIYRNNPFLLIFAYLNRFLIYPLLSFIYRRRISSEYETRNFPSLILIFIIFSLIIWLLSGFFRIFLPFNEFYNGLLLSGFFIIIAYLGTTRGASPLYPIWNRRIQGNVNSISPHEKRIKNLIMIPFSIIILEFILFLFHNSLSFYLQRLNLVFLFVIWVAYLHSSKTLKQLFKLPRYTGSSPNPVGINPTKSPLSPFNIIKPHFNSTIEKTIFNKLNESRKKSGLKPLKFDNGYANLCRSHSGKMAHSGGIYHGNNVEKTHGSYSGENVAMVYGGKSEYQLGVEFHSNWMKSPGHRSNIMNKNFSYVGIGVVKYQNKYYGTQLFSN